MPRAEGSLGEMGLRTKIPRATGQLSLQAATREKPAQCIERSHVLQLRPDAAK